MQGRIEVSKRIFDIVVAGILLLCLSPLFLLVMLAIRLESKGSVFYSQPRVGMDYEIFPFFKFRSMYVGADKQVQQLMSESQYGESPANRPKAQKTGRLSVQHMRISDDGIMSEEEFRMKEKDAIESSFFKSKDDPRITRVGKFIRNTSIDELPQLFNVLRGEMSLVGNRPLPLYEAEKLTEDRYIQRFMAPAGITGYWQVTDRGKAAVSGEARKLKDVLYAQKRNFFFDIWILLKTPLAAIQKENV